LHLRQQAEPHKQCAPLRNERREEKKKELGVERLGPWKGRNVTRKQQRDRKGTKAKTDRKLL